MKKDENSFKDYCLTSFLVSNTIQSFNKGLAFAEDIFGPVNDGLRQKQEKKSDAKESLNLFQAYRKKIEDDIKKIEITKHSLNANLYCSDSIFVCLGKYDFMGLSLTDWPVFDTRHFMPNSPSLEQGQEFEHYINRGLLLSPLDSTTGKVAEVKGEPAENPLMIFYKESKNYDCVGMIKLKVNPFLLIGNGALFTSTIKNNIQTTLDIMPDVKGIVLDSLDYCEFICYVFSNCPYNIVKAITHMRNLQVKDIGEELKVKLIEDSLFPNHVKNKCDENHLVYYTNSRIGFRYGLQEFKSKRTYNFVLYFTIKPGHTKRFLSRLKNTSLKTLEPSMTFGRNDLHFHNVPLTINEYLKLIKDISCQPISEDIVGMTSNLISERKDINKELKDIDEISLHFDGGTEILEMQQINLEKIKKLSTSMKELNISLNTQQRVLLTINTLNRSLVDHTNFSFFIELRKYVEEHILNEIANKLNYSNKTEVLPFEAKILEEILHRALNTYDIAFQNRFFKNHTLQEISDFRLSFNGGVHHLISLVDSTYKVLTDAFSPRKKSYDNICYIGNRHDTISYIRALEINYSHLFFPSIFYMVVSHEAGNFLLEKTLLAYSEYNKNRNQTYKNNETGNKLNEKENNYLTRLLLKLVKDYIPKDNNEEREINETTQRIDNNFDVQFKSVYDKVQYEDTQIVKDRMNYLFVDMLNFYTTFNQDIELFIYYHWMFLLQSTENYKISVDQEGKLTIELIAEDYYTMCLRLSTLCELFGDGQEYLKTIFKIDPTYEAHNFDVDVEDEVNAFMNAKRFINASDFFESAKDFIADIIHESILTSHVSIVFKNTDQFLSEIKQHLNQNIEMISASFKDSTPVYFEPNCDSDLMYISSIMHAHLKQEYEVLEVPKTINKYKTNTLGINPLIRLEKVRKNQDWYINPKGGFSVLCPEKRKTLFKLNHTSTECLWDFSQKFKKVLFN